MCVGVIGRIHLVSQRRVCLLLINNLQLIGCRDFHLELDIEGPFSLTFAMVRVVTTVSRALLPFLQKRTFPGISSQVKGIVDIQ